MSGFSVILDHNTFDDTDQFKNLAMQILMDVLDELNRRLDAGEADCDEYHRILDAVFNLCIAVGIGVKVEYPAHDGTG